MTFGSLFSGVGGIDLALEQFGHAPLWQAEKDPAARRVLAQHWPRVKCFGDVTLMVGGEMPGTLRKLTQLDAENATKMYNDGASVAPIAKHFGVSRQAMWDLLRRRTEMRSGKRTGPENHFYRGGVRADDKSHDLVEDAIDRGVLVRPQTCETCGTPGAPYKDGRASIQAHHDDYNSPLSVRWLCQGCHHEWHRHNQPIRKEVPEEVPAVDVICGGFP